MYYRKLLLLFVMIILFVESKSQTDNHWKTIYTFSGSSNEATDDFLIKADKWRIVWEAKKQYSDFEGGNLAIYLVYPNGDEDFIANTLPTNFGKTIIRKKGTFYFKISSLLVKWKIEVQEYKEN
ncbi:MAG: hypothetical protein FJW56_01955 [Actinobacteria bacterium]|nr:hypothetical protein [Actinomycetota bacterium]